MHARSDTCARPLALHLPRADPRTEARTGTYLLTHLLFLVDAPSPRGARGRSGAASMPIFISIQLVCIRYIFGVRLQTALAPGRMGELPDDARGVGVGRGRARKMCGGEEPVATGWEGGMGMGVRRRGEVSFMTGQRARPQATLGRESSPRTRKGRRRARRGPAVVVVAGAPNCSAFAPGGWVPVARGAGPSF